MRIDVAPSGNKSSGFVICGERPGRKEYERGVGFVGASGQILWSLIRLFGLSRTDCWVTNLDKSYHHDNADPDWYEVQEHWGPELDRELKRVGAWRILAVGRHALEWLTGSGASVMSVCGLEFPWRHNPDVKVYPCVHPAKILHDLQEKKDSRERSELYLTYLGIKAWAGHGAIVKEQWKDPTLNPSQYPIGRLFIDLEGAAGAPVSVAVSEEPGSAVIVYADDKDGLDNLVEACEGSDQFVFHSALGDLEILRSPGWASEEFRSFWDRPFKVGELHDTMIDAYNLCEWDKGLKDLMLRHYDFHGLEFPEDYKTFVSLEYAKWCKGWWRRAHVALKRKLSNISTHTEKGNRRKRPKRLYFGTDWELEALKRAKSAATAKSKINTENRLKSASPAVLDILTRAAGPEPRFDQALMHVPKERRELYIARDPAFTAAVYAKLQDRIAAEDLERCNELDQSIVPMMARAQQIGIHVDRRRLDEVGRELQKRIDEKLEILKLGCGEDFNPSSPDQVAELLYERLGLGEGKEIRQTNTGRLSTDKDALSHMRDDGAVEAIKDYRAAKKLKSTYVDPIPSFLDEHDDLHPTWKLATVPSGRLACEDPNLMAWPVRTDLAKLCRSYFSARESRVLGSWDLNQIEMRLLAHYSQDPLLLDVFVGGKDFHSLTAQRVLGAEVDSTGRAKTKLRDPAKVINYMIIYGGRPSKLQDLLREQEIEWPIPQCEEALNGWSETYSTATRWMRSRWYEVAECGYITSPITGRRRYIPEGALQGDRWPMPHLRHDAFKQAGNHPIQGGAADLVKRGMRRFWEHVYPEVRKRGWVELLLQVHDEVIAEFEPELWAAVDKGIRWAFTEGLDWMTVPVLMEGKMGYTWGELK